MLPQIGAGAFAREEERLRKEHERLKAIGGDMSSGTPAPVVREEKIGRNDTVTITNGSVSKEMKYKKAESLIASGEWKLVD